MALEKEVSYSGQNKTGTLTAKLRTDEGKGRQILFDGTYNRMIIGVFPDGTVGIIISKPGIDVFDVFN